MLRHPNNFRVSRADVIIRWVEKYCRRPDTGEPVQLSLDQREAVRTIYNTSDTPHVISAAKHLAAYLTLMHVVGPEALPRKVILDFAIDGETVWSTASPALRAYLERDGNAITCRGLRTKSCAAA